MKLEFSREKFQKKKYSNMKFHENPTSRKLVVPCEQTDMAKVLVRTRLK